MAWPNFSLTDLYTALITNLNSRLQETGKLFNGVTTTGAEFTDQVRYNSSTKKLETWNGSAWVALDMSGTGIAAASVASGTVTANLTGNVTGNVTGNAATASSCSGNSNTATTATNSAGTGTIPKAGENGLRIVRGVINSAGTIIQGAGFTTSKISAGIYEITFSPGYSSAPTIISSVYAGNATLTYWATISINVARVLTTQSNGTAVDSGGFSFIAIGPN